MVDTVGSHEVDEVGDVPEVRTALAFVVVLRDELARTLCEEPASGATVAGTARPDPTRDTRVTMSDTPGLSRDVGGATARWTGAAVLFTAALAVATTLATGSVTGAVTASIVDEAVLAVRVTVAVGDGTIWVTGADVAAFVVCATGADVAAFVVCVTGAAAACTG